MMDEHFMRGWTHSHEQLSLDLTRGLAWLGARFRRFAESVAPGHAPGEDSYLGDGATDRPAKTVLPGRAARRR